MKVLRFFIGCALLFVLTVGIVSCKQDEKPYTPLSIYFNPLKLDMSVEMLMPYFVNYPSDWAKLGLKGFPKDVIYQYSNASWNFSSEVTYTFSPYGKLTQYKTPSFNVGATGFDVITLNYDDNYNICQIISKEDLRGEYSDKGFIYDSTDKLIRREKMGRSDIYSKNYIYDYHENGALKSIMPEKEDDLTTENGVPLYKLYFDSSNHLERVENVKTTNILMKDISKYKTGVSVTSFFYTDNLCTKAVEEIPVQFDSGTKKVVCTSTFKYNDRGDMTEWNYSGGVYKNKGNSWRVDDMNFRVTYDYVYDKKGNWIQAKITYPENLDEIPALRSAYKAKKSGFYSNQDKSPSTREGEAPFVTIKRLIEYFEDNFIKNFTAELRDKNKDANRDNGLIYKGTDTKGLFGEVKSVTMNDEVAEFDKAGNLVYKKDRYGYETRFKFSSSTSYTINSINDEVINITIKGNSRSDLCNNFECNNQEYLFDHNGRLIKHVFCSYMDMSIIKHEYEYESEGKHPVVMREESPEEKITYRYTYHSFDKKNNWTERKVVYTSEYDKYDDNGNFVERLKLNPQEYIEKRTIKYW